MLTSLTVYLFPVEDAILPPTMGHYIHAAFLNIAREMDSKIAEQLHEEQSCKPFTVSPLQGKFGKQGKDRILIRAGTECWVRFTVLDDYLLSAIVRFFAEGDSTMLCLGGQYFQVTRVAANEGGVDSNWSACTTFEELMDRASSFNKLNIRFYSPTAFKVHNRGINGAQNHVFPDAPHCFHSWVRKWNALSAIKVNEAALMTFVQENIHFSRYSIKTKIMNFGGYKQLGFVGDCEYRLVNGNGAGKSGLLKHAEALANFAFYCGTGYKTTMGMGQTRMQECA